MEQIIVTRPDSTIYNLVNRQTATKVTSAKQSWGLLDRDVVNITVETPYPQSYGIGDSITVFGRTYKLHRLPKAKKAGAQSFSYDLEFEGMQYDLMRATFNLSIDTTSNEIQDVQGDDLTGDLNRFATVLIANANRVFPGVWALGSCPATEADKTLKFHESDNCLSVLQKLCKEFSVEFEISRAGGAYVINFVEIAGQLLPFTFQFGRGKGIYQLDRKNVDSSNLITRLYVYGSSSNITNKYRANRLCLPGKNKGQSFIEKPEAVAKFGIYEATKFFDDIKPTFDGEITGVIPGSVLQFTDLNMFDLNALEADGKTHKYMLPGVKPKIHINSGNLAGYQFEIHEYNHGTHTFTVVRQDDKRGDEFPSGKSQAFQFSVGNKYKILNIALPAEYDTAAENKLAEQGEIYYDKNSQPRVQYSLSVTKSYLKQFITEGTQVNIFKPGDYIPIKDEDIDVDKAVRIKSLERDLLDEYEYSLTISDTVNANITSRVVSKLIEHDNIITINNLKDPAQARTNWRSSQEVLAMTFDPDGNYYTEKIRPESIDTIALSVGAKSMQFGLTNTILEPNYGGDANLLIVKGGVLAHYTIDESTTRNWNLADNQTTLASSTQAYYIYARCEREGTAGSIIFSEQQIPVEHEAGHYHFWIGVVNSVDPEMLVRSISLSYGYSTINGRFIKTGRIQSADSNTFFDLDSGVISGKIKFMSGAVENDLDVWAGGIETDIINAETAISEAQSIITALDTYVDGAFHDGVIEESEAKSIEKYLNQLNAQGGELNSLYSKLYANSLLTGTPKSNLETAKNNFFGDLTTLISTIQTVIADGRVTSAEKDDVDYYFTFYRNSLSTFSTRIEEANQAVQQTIKTIADDALAKANISKAVTDKFGTTIDGGLINSVMMLLRDINQTTETAGISGIRGEALNNPAFWAGGTYSQAMALIGFLLKMSEGTTPDAGEYNSLSRIALLHNGAAKLGDFIIESNGRIVMVDPDTGKPRLVFNTSDIPAIDDLVGGITDNGSTQVSAGAVNNTVTEQILCSFTLGRDNTPIKFNGTELSLNAKSTVSGYTMATLRVLRNGAPYYLLGTLMLSFSNSGSLIEQSDTRTIQPITLNGCPAGNYSLRLEISQEGGISFMDAHTVASLISWEFTQAGVRYFQFGLNGMMAFFSNNHWHFTETGGFDLRGKTNMPGVLLSGGVAVSGGVSNIWGNKEAFGGFTSTGRAKINHNLNHTKYIVQTQIRLNGITVVVDDIFPTYFTCSVRNSSGTLVSAPFDFTMIGDNYA